MSRPKKSEQEKSRGPEQVPMARPWLPWEESITKCEEGELYKAKAVMNSERVVQLPVWCLRWTHDKIHSQMVFGQGRRKESSIYELVHNLQAGRWTPESLPPLKVVLDGQHFFSLSNRRLAALHMFQALRKHEVIEVPCQIYSPDSPCIRQKYKDSLSTDPSLGPGLGLKLHPYIDEAYHMGKPLFKTASEWPVDSMAAGQASPPAAVSPGQSPKLPPPLSPPELTGSPPLRPTESPKAPPGSTTATPATPPQHPAKTPKNARKAPGPPLMEAKSVAKTQWPVPSPSTLPLGQPKPPPGLPKLSALPGPPQPPKLPPCGGLLPPEAGSPAGASPKPPAPPAKCPASGKKPAPVPATAPAPAPPAPVQPDSPPPVELPAAAVGDEVGSDPSEAEFVQGQLNFGESVFEGRPSMPDDPRAESDSEDEVAARSESDAESPENEDEEEEIPVENRYEKREDLEAELAKPQHLQRIADLRGKLVYGTFCCTSGSDFQGRRSRAELLVERGPRDLLGCRVHVIGQANRNRAWHFDQSWVRIKVAKVARSESATTQSSQWTRETSQKTMLYGQVVRAEESAAPRQTLIICLRSKIVRSRKSMMFRAINGKFPLIAVPWESALDPPSLFDLHVIEVVGWTGSLPFGNYCKALNMRHHNASILKAVQISLNFADWPLEEGLGGVHAQQVGAHMLKDAAHLAAGDGLPKLRAVCIQHQGFPASLALSMQTCGKHFLDVHVADVNSHLDTDALGALEEQLRHRAVGAWFLDYLEQAVKESLPLLPPNLEQHVCFQPGTERLAMTFRFPVNAKSREVDLDKCECFQSLVHCEAVYPYQQAEELIHSAGAGMTSSASPMLKEILKVTTKLEHAAEEAGLACLLQHMAPNLLGKEQTGTCGCPSATGIVACCAYMVNRHAGKELSQAKLWAEFLHPGVGPRPKTAVPLLVRAQADPFSRRSAANLLFQSTQADRPLETQELGVKDIFKALRTVLGRKGLNPRQKECLQAAFLRQARICLPSEAYRLVNYPAHFGHKPKSSGAAESSIFTVSPVFHITSPAQRYLDILGMRVLKMTLGLRAQAAHMTPSPEQLQEAVARTNMRQEACHMAQNIFRQISLMRGVEPAGWLVKDAVVCSVSQSSVQLVAPVSGCRAGVNLMLPSAALRGAGCSLEFEPEQRRLKVTSCYGHDRGQQRTRCRWTIEPWGRSTIASVVVSRNFAQPVRHHASLNAVVPTDITFLAQACGSADKVHRTLGIGHIMFPEVFSTWPNLEEWYLVESDIKAYSQAWHGIRLCQTHAAAVAAPIYTARLPTQLNWYKAHGKECCMVSVSENGARYGDHLIQPKDLAIIRCCSGDKVATVYGIVSTARPAQTQVKTRLCNIPGCNDAKCPWAHSEEEMRGQRLKVEVELSEVSHEITQCQKLLGEGASSRTFTVQFVNVPFADRTSLERIESLPRYAQSRTIPPVLNYLTGSRGPRQKQALEADWKLATDLQVETALRGGHFVVEHREGQRLNAKQRSGLWKGLQQAFSLVQGPPGTGKTTFLVHLAVALLNLEADPTLDQWRRAGSKSRVEPDQQVGRILICTPSNQAADEIVTRLRNSTDVPDRYITRIYARSIEAAHGSKYKGSLSIDARADVPIRRELQEHSLHFRTGCRPPVEQKQRDLSSKSAAGLRDFNNTYEQEELVVLKDSRIVVTTCTSACSHSALTRNEKSIKFATVIIDEAAQATEVDVVLPALLADQRVVLVGDHKQLGPVVTENCLCRAYLGALGTSMLERLYRTPELLPDNTMLERQYRMHASIRNFPSEQFYSSKLEDDASIITGHMHPSIWPAAGEHVVFIDCTHPHSMGEALQVGKGMSRDMTTMENNTSLKNEGEAALVAEACKRILERQGCKPSEIAIVTPYAAQRELIKTVVKQVCRVDIDVGTVHSLQGAEREYTVNSFVRSVTESLALCQNGHSTAATDIVVAPSKKDEAVRQINESNIGIVGNSQILNVSITRAKQGLVLIGNRRVLAEGSEDFYNLTEAYQKRGCVVTEAEFRRSRG